MIKKKIAIITGIYGPMLGGLLGGSDYNVLGPAGALVNVLHAYYVKNGVKIIPYLAIFSGVISFLVYLFKLEKYCTVLPIAVLEGFSFAVALTIGVSQLNFAFGIDPATLKKHPLFY